MAIAERSWTSPILQTLWHDLDEVRGELQKEVSGLSHAQLAFQPVHGAWSIAMILDHLGLSERSITRTVSRLLQRAAGLGQIAELGHWDGVKSEIDAALYGRPASAPESVRPAPDRELSQLLADLDDSRQRFEAVTRQADGMAVGPITLPHFQLGELNFYQWLAVEAAHETKHLAAIRRIEADPRFPSA